PGRAVDGRVPVHSRSGADRHDRPVPRPQAARGRSGAEAHDGHRGPRHGADDAVPLRTAQLDRRVIGRLRDLVLLQPDLMPPDDLAGTTERERQPWLSLYHVITTLRELGHEVKVLGVQWELGPIRHEVVEWKPHVVFNLLEEFYGMVEFDH